MLSKKEAYICLSAMLRAREPKLLNAERASRMIEAASGDEAAKMLSELGYGDLSGKTAKEIGTALNSHREEIFSEIDRLAPEKDIADLFRMKYDYHNAKVLIKAEATGTCGDELMSGSGRIAPEKLKELYTEEHYNLFPGHLGEAVREAKNVFAATINPQLTDFSLDRGWFAEMRDTAVNSGNTFLREYVALLTDTANLKSAVRTLRMGKPSDFLREALLPGGTVELSRLLSVTDGDALKTAFSGTVLEKAAGLGAEAVSGGKLTAFEKACDDAVNGWLRKAKMISFGSEPVAAYLAAVENEITAVRMILTGKLSGISGGILRERLRELYA